MIRHIGNPCVVRIICLIDCLYRVGFCRYFLSVPAVLCGAPYFRISILLFGILACCLSCHPASAQRTDGSARLDTIYATTSQTTSLIFPSKITIYDIGNDDFGAVKEGNLLLLKAAHDQAAPASLLIKYGETIYHGTLAYSVNPTDLFIDFSKPDQKAIPGLPNETRLEKDDSLKSIAVKIAGKRLNMLLSDPKSYYKSVAVKKVRERISLALTNLRTDEGNVYLKLLLINDSRLDYGIDFVEFVYQDPPEDKSLKGAFNRKNVYATVSNRITLVGGKDRRFIGYAIPRYTLGKKGELVIIVREQNGSRTIALSLPFKLILEAENINK